jgi:ATP-dependent exoDNAse (exonuclease V) beta subunit
MTKVPGDHDARTALLTELDTTFVVEAAAGTGKTTVLVGRIAAVVRTGRARLSQIIAVTFTEKAAGEMKLRLRDRLERERNETKAAEEVERLTTALEELEVARIGTIHGLCADLLREYPVEAQVDPLFEVAAEGEASATVHAAFTRQFQELLRQPPEGVRRVLRRRGRGQDDQPRSVLLEAVERLIEHRDFGGAWRRDPFDRDALIDSLVDQLEGLAAMNAQLGQRRAGGDTWFLEPFQQAERFMSDLHHREAVATRDHDGLEAQLRDLGGNKGKWTARPFNVQCTGITEAQAIAARDGVWDSLREFIRKSEADIAACVHQELWPVVEAYEAEKARRGVLDFVDLLIKTRDVIRSNVHVRTELQRRFTRLFVDEFQDTDPLQSEIVLLLASDDPHQTEAFRTRAVAGKLFVVGDPKQSIYRFRRADVALYQRVKAHLVSHGARLEYLSTSFRSTPGIQAAVNASFAEPMSRSGQAGYVPLGEWRAPFDHQPSLVALPSPTPFNEKGRVTKGAVEASLPGVVAGFIDWLVRRSGWTVQEGDDRIPVEARHVCILFKRLRSFGSDVPRPYAQALDARRVPHVLVGGRSFHLREEVTALRTALLAVERPDDELSVFATLRGPFFAFTDEQLLVFRDECRSFSPLRKHEAEKLSPDALLVYEALEVLRRLHFNRNRQPAASTLNEFLEVTRAHAGVAFWAAGQQALANVLQLAEVARRYEERSISFRDVVEALQDEADSGEVPDAPIVEEGTEGVRMMTVHAAKGLEFPVVILADALASASSPYPSHWVDVDANLWVHSIARCIPSELREHEAEVLERDREESVRVTYVAATRAKDLLVVPICSDKRFDETWTSVLGPALWPAAGTGHSPRPAPGCPTFGRDVVLDRQFGVPDDVPLPGRHVAESRKNGVVWWDPKTLDLAKEERTGLEASDALVDEPSVSAEVRANYESWRAGLVATIDAGSVPKWKVRAARDLKFADHPDDIGLEHTDVPREGRPHGRRFGELVHAVLAHVPLDSKRDFIERVVGVHAHALQAPTEEREAAVAAIESALRHPLLRSAKAALEVRRETPVVDVLGVGEMLEGTIDLAFRDANGWTVVEFKTDDDLEAHLPEYQAQTEAYVKAIGGATKERTRGVLLRV